MVSDANTLLTLFLPHAAQQIHQALGGTGVWAAQPEIREVSEEGGPDYPVIMGDHEVSKRAGSPNRSRRERRWSGRRRSSPRSMKSSARPARNGLPSNADSCHVVSVSAGSCRLGR